MLVLNMLQWWYSRGWLELFKKTKATVKGIYLQFSVATLLKTLFAPWKQIVAIKDPNQTIQMRLRGVLDTLVSRVVGFLVRTVTLLAAAFVIAALVVFGVVMLVIWPLIPLAVPALIAKGAGLL